MLAVEAQLTPKWRSMPELAAEVFDSNPPTPSQIQSVRRAVLRLKEQGKAQAMRDSHGNDDWTKVKPGCRRGSPLWTLTLVARNVPTPEEEAEEYRSATAALKRMSSTMVGS
jgi:hypothetical protein